MTAGRLARFDSHGGRVQTQAVYHTFEKGVQAMSSNPRRLVDNLDFEIPAPLFADGFESGDVSAWS